MQGELSWDIWKDPEFLLWHRIPLSDHVYGNVKASDVFEGFSLFLVMRGRPRSILLNSNHDSPFFLSCLFWMRNKYTIYNYIYRKNEKLIWDRLRRDANWTLPGQWKLEQEVPNALIDVGWKNAENTFHRFVVYAEQYRKYRLWPISIDVQSNCRNQPWTNRLAEHECLRCWSMKFFLENAWKQGNDIVPVF